MLQISTGKFFDESKKRRHNGKFVFYSNVHLLNELNIPSPLNELNIPSPLNELNIPSPLIEVEEVESGAISCYVVSYQLITEQDPLVIKCGDQDLIAQFILIWAFYFDCIARTQREIAQKICREKKISTYDQQTLSEVSPNTVELGRKLNKDEIDNFKGFIEKIVKANRKIFKSTITALKIIDDAKETVSTNFDLAYSTLVYVIESLSQKHDGYEPVWEDYDDKVRQKIEPILGSIESEKSEHIKTCLLEGKQFKLRQRLKMFVEKYLSEGFYRTYLGENTNTLRKSYLTRCLNNLYQLRSSFVHELKPLDVMLSSPHSPYSDYIMRFGEPYLTFTGLNRLIREIIINFVSNNITDEKEKLKWFYANETSSVISIELAAEYWIHKPEAFSQEKVNKWFAEYIPMLDVRKVTDQSEIMSKIESIFDNSKKEYRCPLLHYYWLYNAMHNREDDRWKKFIHERESYLGQCIHFYVVILYLFNELSYRKQKIKLDEFDRYYSKYLKEKFHKSGLLLSGFVEAGLLSAAANVALSEEELERFENYLNRALPEVANNRKNYFLIEDALQNRKEVDLKKYFDLSNGSVK